MTFRVGQKVVCIDVTNSPELVLRAVYTVEFVDTNCRGGAGIDLVEAIPPEGRHRWAYNPRRFRPAVERKTNISIFTAMLNRSKRRVTA